MPNGRALSRMTLSSGMPRPMAMPTTLIEEMAADIGSQCTRSSPSCWVSTVM